MIKAQAASSKYGVNMTNDEYMKAGKTFKDIGKARQRIDNLTDILNMKDQRIWLVRTSGHPDIWIDNDIFKRAIEDQINSENILIAMLR